MPPAAPYMTDAETGRHARHNFIAHTIEGGVYMGGLALLNETTVLPALVASLGGPPWLTSLTPVLLAVGYMVPPILTAHWIERARRFKPMCMVTGVFQRLPYLAAGLVLMLAAGSHPRLALAVVALAPLVSGLSGGITLTGWQQLLIKTVPARRRPAMLGLREVLSCLLGIAAGWVVRGTLDARPGPEGYGLLCLGAFGVTTLSYLLFATIRERPHEPPPEHQRTTFAGNLRQLPALIRAERQFATYLLTLIFVNGLFIAAPFLALHARDTLGRGDGYIGELIVAQMLGAIVGNLAAGHVGGRFGSKPVMLACRAFLLAAVLWATVAADDWSFRAIFFLFGLGYFSHRVSNMSIVLEICPLERRSTYLAITSLAGVPSMLAAVGLCAAVRQAGGSFALTALLAAASLAASLGFATRLREPRRT